MKFNILKKKKNVKKLLILEDSRLWTKKLNENFPNAAFKERDYNTSIQCITICIQMILNEITLY